MFFTEKKKKKTDQCTVYKDTNFGYNGTSTGMPRRGFKNSHM